VTLAQNAVTSGVFKDEIAPVTVSTRKGDTVVDTRRNADEVRCVEDLEAEACLQEGRWPHASQLVVDFRRCSSLCHDARIGCQGCRHHAAGTHRRPFDLCARPVVVHHGAGVCFPEGAQESGWQAEDVDLWEINEAFAAVTMASMRDLKLSRDKVNVNGGACALGHPIGATGSRILVTLLYALKARGLKRGIAGLCAGGGEATAIAIEVL
jgi:acetyl-CoA C-acetyltransferase